MPGKLFLSLVGVCSSVAGNSAVVTFVDRTSFDAANPGLLTEGFEAANLPNPGAAVFTGPLSSSTSNAVFAPGSVLAGFSLNTTNATGTGSGSVVFAGRNVLSVPTVAVGNNISTDNLRIVFSVPVMSVALDLRGTSNLNNPWTVELNGTANMLGSYLLPTGGFFGASADTLITSIYLNLPNTGGVIDNLSFGTAAAAAVPEPEAWASMIAGFMLAGCALRNRRRPHIFA